MVVLVIYIHEDQRTVRYACRVLSSALRKLEQYESELGPENFAWRIWQNGWNGGSHGAWEYISRHDGPGYILSH